MQQGFWFHIFCKSKSHAINKEKTTDNGVCAHKQRVGWLHTASLSLFHFPEAIMMQQRTVELIHGKHSVLPSDFSFCERAT
jgi:hypothetical protein